MTEADLQKQCIQYCYDNDVLAYKVETPARRGFPDLLLVFPGGRTTFVELKHPNGHGTLSALQLVTINSLLNQGADVHVIDNYEYFTTLVTKRNDRATAGSDNTHI